jgi:hypothetical protein
MGNLEIRTPLDALVGKKKGVSEIGNCENTRVYTNYDPSNQSATEEFNYEYQCFERDESWGYLSISFMCVPGLFFWAFVTFR